MGKSTIRDHVWIGCVASILAVSAHSARLHRFSGKVSWMAENERQWADRTESSPFAIGLSPEYQELLKPGENVTVWYSVKVNRVIRQETSHQSGVPHPPLLPTLAPEDFRERAAPDHHDPVQALPVIQDDRAFYHAKSQDRSPPLACS